jgi:hypothetical protein
MEFHTVVQILVKIGANKMVASGSPKLASNYLLQGRNTKQLSKTQNPHLN